MSSTRRRVQVCSDRRLRCGMVTRAQLDKASAPPQTSVAKDFTGKKETKVRRVQKRLSTISLDLGDCGEQNIKRPYAARDSAYSSEQSDSEAPVFGGSASGTYQAVCAAVTTPVTGLIQYIDQVFLIENERRSSSSSSSRSSSSCPNESSSSESSRSNSPTRECVYEEIIPCQVTTEEAATRLSRYRVRYPSDNRTWNVVQLRNDFPIRLSSGSPSNFVAWKLMQNHYVFAFEGASNTFYVSAPSRPGPLKLTKAGVDPMQISNVSSDPRVFRTFYSDRTNKWYLRPASGSNLFVGLNNADFVTVERVPERNAKSWRVSQ